MTNTSTRTSRKASTARKPARVPTQAPAAEENRADMACAAERNRETA